MRLRLTTVPWAWLVSGLGVLLIAFGIGGSPIAAQTTIKVAYWNIKSARGQIGPSGHPVKFANTSNCTDSSQPLNAWGVGFVQAELKAALADPSTIALGLQEAWLCGIEENVRTALGWAARTSGKNASRWSPATDWPVPSVGSSSIPP